MPQPSQRAQQWAWMEGMAQVGANTACHRLRFDTVRTARAVIDYIAQSDWSNVTSQRASVAMATGVEIAFGIPFCDSLALGVGRHALLGGVFSDVLEINVGTGYYAGDECLQPMTLVLPLPIFLRPLAQKVCQPGHAVSLDDLAGDAVRIERHILLERATGTHIAKSAVPRLRLDSAFRAIAMDRCGIAPTVVSHLLAQPLAGQRGPCDYGDVTPELLGEALGAVWDAFLSSDEALGQERAQGKAHPPVKIHHKAHTIDVTAAFGWLEGRIRTAASRNELVAVTVAFFRMTCGLRPRGDHISPSNSRRSTPVAALNVCDKSVQGSDRARWIALMPPIQEVLDALDIAVPHGGILPYQHGGRYLRFSELPRSKRDALLREWLWIDAEKNGRVVFFNALLAVGASQMVLDSLMGHGPEATQWNSHACPVPTLSLLEMQTPVLQAMYERFGVPAMAAALADKLRALPPCPIEMPDATPHPQPSLRRKERKGSTQGLSVPPLTREEHALYQRLLTGLTEASHDKRLLADFVIASGLEGGIPPEYFVRYSAYLDYNCLAWVGDAARDDRAVFCAPLTHPDAGGLSLLLVPLEGTAGAAPLAPKLLRLLADRVRVGGRHSLLLNEAPGDFHSWIGARVARLLYPTCCRCPMDARSGYDLLQKIAMNVAAWRHGGLVAGVLAGGPVSLNHADPYEVARMLFGDQPLVGMDGQPWRPSHEVPDLSGRGIKRFISMMRPCLPTSRKRRSRGRPLKPPKGCDAKKPLVEWTTENWLPVFSACFERPYVKGFTQCLKLAGLGRRARRMAESIFARLMEPGAFRFSRPFPLREVNWPTLREQIAAAAKEHAPAGLRDLVATEMTSLAALLLSSQMRPDESFRLTCEATHLSHGDLIIRNDQGKTRFARRAISLRSICPDSSLTDEVLAYVEGRIREASPTDLDSLWPTLASIWGRDWRGRRIIDGRKFHRILAKVLADAGDLDPYDLRHSGCFERLRHWLSHPQQWYAIATQAAEMGHAGPLQQWVHYIGTAIIAVMTPSLRTPPNA